MEKTKRFGFVILFTFSIVIYYNTEEMFEPRALPRIYRS
jgi:hypothetical protein